MGTGKKWDVIVIGGGPAGMMAAGRAAECGARVLLIEKNESLGKKLLISGGGRCNLTNAEFDTRKLLSHYKEASKFLHSPFSQFGVQDTISFFENRGMGIKIEAGKRAFPKSDQSESVLHVLQEYMKQHGVTVRVHTPIKHIIVKHNILTSVVCENGDEEKADSFIFATGGTSRPDTGSTGEAFTWMKELGHHIVPPDASLVPIVIEDTWVKNLQGITLENIGLHVFQKGKKQFSKKGRILFTHFGISGPTVINMSKDIRDLLPYGPVTLSLDLYPMVGHDAMNERVLAILDKDKNKKLKNVISDLLPVSAMIKTLFSLTEINPESFCHSVRRDERMALIALLKHLPMTVKGILGAEKAIVTSGGVPLNEIDTKTMRSTMCNNLYLTGDMLDIDRPSGGYSLQLCWTSGFVAGTAASQKEK